eukprot:tig00020537_g10282.t1
MGGGSSRRRSPPPPPPPPPRPPPPPPAPPTIPPPPVVVSKPPVPQGPVYPPMRIAPEQVQTYPDGRGWFTEGGPKYGTREVVKIIRKVLGDKADPPTKLSGDSGIDQKALKIPEAVQRYTKALCHGTPRFGTKSASGLHGKCMATGTDLSKSKDFQVKMDRFKFLKIAKDLKEKPGQVIIAESDNSSGVAQLERVTREATIKDTHSMKTHSTIETGVNAVVEGEVSVSVVSVTARAETNLKVNFSSSKEQKFEKSSTITLEKDVKVPAFGHADVIWTINEGQSDLPWEARFGIEGSYNLFYWVPPGDRMLVSMCATALEAFFEQGVLYKEGFEEVPDYLQKCGLHVIRIPVCEALAWGGKVSEHEKGFSKCYWKTTGTYHGVQSTSWKSQVETRPVSRELDDWQLALYRGQALSPHIAFVDGAQEGLDQLREHYKVAARERHAAELKRKAGDEAAARKAKEAPAPAPAEKEGEEGGEEAAEPAKQLDAEPGVGPEGDAGDVAEGGAACGAEGAAEAFVFAGDLHPQAAPQPLGPLL